ncbi:MAG: substrate-binding domain-containing protein, partial [Candidatus Puniceispirillaceae bacterium]
MTGVGAFAASASSIVVQSTTSTKNSGFYDYLLPVFTKETGIQVHVVAVGTGAAVRNSMNCDGDVMLVHSRAREEAFVREGYA